MGEDTIFAVQDTGCLDRLKFRCALSAPISSAQCEALKKSFNDNQVTHHAFSKTVPGGRDLLSIARLGEYQLDLVVGDATLVFSFVCPDKTWPIRTMNKVTARLSLSGFPPIAFEANAEAAGAFGDFYEDGTIRAMVKQSRIDRPLARPHIHATEISQTCGSRVTIEACLDEAGRISDIGYQTKACDIATLATLILSRNALDLSLKEIVMARASLKKSLLGQAARLPWPELFIFSAIHDLPHRHAAVFLAFDALVTALRELETTADMRQAGSQYM